MLHEKEDFCKLSKRDMQRMWRTLKAEQGRNIVTPIFPSLPARSLSYWMTLMEDRLQQEVTNRPNVWERLLRGITGRHKWT